MNEQVSKQAILNSLSSFMLESRRMCWRRCFRKETGEVRRSQVWGENGKMIRRVDR